MPLKKSDVLKKVADIATLQDLKKPTRQKRTKEKTPVITIKSLLNITTRVNKFTLRDVQKIAEAHGGTCLGTEYLGTASEMRFRCKNGHEWTSYVSAVFGGAWCQKCKHAEKLEELRTTAHKNGGLLLETTYLGANTKHRFKCGKCNYEWATQPRVIKDGHWCPKCAKNVRHTIEEMQAIAAKHEGKCLSEEYFDTKTPLLFKCKEGHRFPLIPFYLLRGNWCPKCKENSKDF